MVQYGWKAGCEQFPPADLLNNAVQAEQAGFDLIDASDHFHPWSEAGQSPFVWTWLGAAAAKTSKIALGPGVTCPILRYHPAIIAQASATLACLAPGRAYLGVGAGEALNEFPVTGLWPDYKERIERLKEAIDLIRALWTGEVVSFHGKYYQTHKARLYSPPPQPIPLYLSALGETSAYIAGTRCDGIFTVGGKPPEIYRQILKQFEQGAMEYGKDPSKMPKLIELTVEYESDVEQAIKVHHAYWAGTYVPAMFNQNLYTPKMSEENGSIVTAETIKKVGCISPRAEEHIAYVRQYLDLGFTHIIFHSARQDQQAFIETYSREVIKPLRELTPIASH